MEIELWKSNLKGIKNGPLTQKDLQSWVATYKIYFHQNNIPPLLKKHHLGGGREAQLTKIKVHSAQYHKQIQEFWKTCEQNIC